MPSLTPILLAAGYGRRIRSITSEPKLLLDVEGVTLLQRHLVHFKALGFQKVILVTGYREERLRQAVKPYRDDFEFRWVKNSDFEHYGSGYSLYLGIRSIEGPALVFDGDLLYERRILEDFLADSHPNALLVGEGDLNDREATKILVDNRGIVHKAIDKRVLTKEELQTYRFLGEAHGILKFSAEGRARLVKSAEGFYQKEENLPLNWEHLLSRFFSLDTVHAHYDPSPNWIEIDTPEDHERACKLARHANL